MPNEGLRWRKLIVNLALGILQASRMDLLSKKGKRTEWTFFKMSGWFSSIKLSNLKCRTKKRTNRIRKGENRKRESVNERPSRGQAVISILSPFVFVFRVCAHDFPSHCLCSEIQENCMTHFETNAAVYKGLTKRWLNRGLSLSFSPTHSLSHQSLIHFNYSQKPESNFCNSLTSRLRPLFCTPTFV